MHAWAREVAREKLKVNARKFDGLVNNILINAQHQKQTVILLVDDQAFEQDG
jgi:hypothetical protein